MRVLASTSRAIAAAHISSKELAKLPLTMTVRQALDELGHQADRNFRDSIVRLDPIHRDCVTKDLPQSTDSLDFSGEVVRSSGRPIYCTGRYDISSRWCVMSLLKGVIALLFSLGHTYLMYAPQESREIQIARAYLQLLKNGLSPDTISQMTGEAKTEVERLIALGKKLKKPIPSSRT
jgi:hypothetical protein